MASDSDSRGLPDREDLARFGLLELWSELALIPFCRQRWTELQSLGEDRFIDVCARTPPRCRLLRPDDGVELDEEWAGSCHAEITAVSQSAGDVHRLEFLLLPR